ncbi:uncharacterized protein LOC126907285 [Daktulosphaira vitifoliae]|uniref:uncharacterized protein LOC126907285 n=1 Tax=Daktulosphaira vitifoliae TaxID=58002 RepID=UPI0021AAD6AD|nr:uncharacterized protein LOC126907285 [Daktulosphaira vitifoliae]
MCRTTRRQHPEMSPQQQKISSYANRLNNLKQVLKPYRDNNANCLRVITRSARVNLNKHWKSLENLFTTSHDGRKERAQNVANERLQENIENTGPTMVNLTSDTVERLRNIHVDR